MGRPAFYNENDPRAAAWLRELIAQGHSLQGERERMSARKVDPNADYRGKWDVAGFWWCDCPGKNPETRRRCRRCQIIRPLRSSPLYSLQHEAPHAGFMSSSELREVRGGEK